MALNELWPIAAIFLSFLAIVGSILINVVNAINNRSIKNEDKKETEFKNSIMQEIRLSKAETLGEIRPLKEAVDSIRENQKDFKLELERRQIEARTKSEELREVKIILQEIKVKVDKIDKLAEEVHDLARDVERLQNLKNDVDNLKKQFAELAFK